jgi:tetratricopeptide (TPR) repeat protein
MIRTVLLFAGLVFVSLSVEVALCVAQGNLPMNFSLQVNGQVRYSESKSPAENVLVRIESFSGGLAGQMMTDRTGKFSFAGLSPTQYIVTIHAPGFIDIRQDVNLATSSSGYVYALLVPDKTSLVNRPSQLIPLSPSVIDSSVPVSAQKEYSTGRALLDQGSKDKIDAALQHVEKALALYPKYLDAQLTLGLIYMDQKEWDKAEKALKAAININPGASTAILALGEVYLREKKFQEAEKTLIDGLTANENSAECHYTLAKVYWEMAPTAKEELQFKQYLEKSWQQVNQALKLNPKYAEAHLFAGNLLLKARRAEASLHHFEEYLKLEPNGEFSAQTQTMVQKIRQALPKTKEDN